MKSLALCMIVKNEEEMLGGCLESIKEFVDEIIVVDTGSSDNTKQIALDHGAKVFDFEWINDFAAARNYAKAQSSCDYVMALDADERFNSEVGDAMRTALNNQGAKVGFIRLTNARSIEDDVASVLSGVNADGTATYLPRFLLNVDGNDWVGRVHEAPTQLHGAFYLDADLVHLGADSDYRSSKGKGLRNLKLLEQILIEDPDQPPIFYSYLAGERESVGDVNGFLEALDIGWKKSLWYVENSFDKGYANSGILSIYPAVLLARNQYKEGLQALAMLIKHLDIFSTNAVNTLWQVIQTCFQVNFPQREKELFYDIILEALNLLIDLHGVSFQEPTISGATSYKALQMQVLVLAKMRRFDEAHAVLQVAYEYKDADAEVTYATQMMHLELLIEQGDLTNCLTMYTDILQENLHQSPDIWILGALLLLVMGQDDDANQYIHRAIDMPNRTFASRHRMNILKGLHVRMSLLKGTPFAGVGAYGVIGSILAREPMKTIHNVPSTLIESVVERYVDLNKVESLLPFFDDRAEHILPGVGPIVQKKLEAYGVVLEDDGKKTPIVIVGDDSVEIEPIFRAHPDMQVVDFTQEEIHEISTELNAAEEQDLEDLLFGGLDLLDEDDTGELVRTKEILSQKLDGIVGNPVLNWHSEWPVSALPTVCSEYKSVFYLGSPLRHASDSTGLYQWHISNASIPSVLGSEFVFVNAKMMKSKPQFMVQKMMAKLGVTPFNMDEVAYSIRWEPSELDNNFPAESDQAILKNWKFI